MTAVLISAFNAAETLGALLEQLSRAGRFDHIVVVDDGSIDTTAAVARNAGVCLLRHERNRGKGAALRTGFEYVVSSTEATDVVTLDSDLQHDPSTIPAFLEARQRSGADIVVGVRKRFGSGMPLNRVFSNAVTSALVSARTGVSIADSQSGFRLISRQVLKAITLEQDGFEAETELLIKASRRGFTIYGIPIATIYRGGKSHMTHVATTVGFLKTLLREY